MGGHITENQTKKKNLFQEEKSSKTTKFYKSYLSQIDYSVIPFNILKHVTGLKQSKYRSKSPQKLANKPQPNISTHWTFTIFLNMAMMTK